MYTTRNRICNWTFSWQVLLFGYKKYLLAYTDRLSRHLTYTYIFPIALNSIACKVEMCGCSETSRSCTMNGEYAPSIIHINSSQALHSLEHLHCIVDLTLHPGICVCAQTIISILCFNNTYNQSTRQAALMPTYLPPCLLFCLANMYPVCLPVCNL